jgi:hypothetical protein
MNTLKTMTAAAALMLTAGGANADAYTDAAAAAAEVGLTEATKSCLMDSQVEFLIGGSRYRGPDGRALPRAFTMMIIDCGARSIDDQKLAGSFIGHHTNEIIERVTHIGR